MPFLGHFITLFAVGHHVWHNGIAESALVLVHQYVYDIERINSFTEDIAVFFEASVLNNAERVGHVGTADVSF